ncbi:hypothetical protein [Micavibrio aeruginosavorus]|uniref:hypothetical protein n=1 Tax=Micavibrio aeruginosavorus TaxID=349221 RepID=UPI0009DAE3E1|nr:hypothetical protein [Micavibrio aeruginosavorus]
MVQTNGLGESFGRCATANPVEDKLTVVMQALERAERHIDAVLDPKAKASRDVKVKAFAELVRVLDVMQDAIATAPFLTARTAQDVADAAFYRAFGLMNKEGIDEDEVRAHVHHFTSSTGGRMISPDFSRRFDA